MAYPYDTRLLREELLREERLTEERIRICERQAESKERSANHHAMGAFTGDCCGHHDQAVHRLLLWLLVPALAACRTMLSAVINHKIISSHEGKKEGTNVLGSMLWKLPVLVQLNLQFCKVTQY